MVWLLGHHWVCLGQEGVSYLDQDFRSRRVEFYLLGQYWHAEDAIAHNVTVDLAPGGPKATGDLKFHADDAGFWGFGVAYNINRHLNVNGEFTFGYPDYTLSFRNSRLSGESFMHGGKFNVEYNVLPGRVTPFLSGGLGYLFVDSGVPSGPTDYYCWWDEWWGQTCVGDTPTYSQTYFTLNAAAGIRWDVNEHFFLKAYAGANWVGLNNSADWLSTIQGTMAVGWKF